jgi:hypothetical protein
VLGVEGTIEVHDGLLDVTGPGLQLDGVLEVRSTPAETGVLRTTTLALPATGHIRFGIARTAPAATAGFVIVTGAAPELAGALDLMPDPSLAVAADQRLTLVSTTAEPTGDPTITGADTLPGSGSRVKVGSGGVTLELVAARG